MISEAIADWDTRDWTPSQADAAFTTLLAECYGNDQGSKLLTGSKSARTSVSYGASKRASVAHANTVTNCSVDDRCMASDANVTDCVQMNGSEPESARAARRRRSLAAGMLLRLAKSHPSAAMKLDRALEVSKIHINACITRMQSSYLVLRVELLSRMACRHFVPMRMFEYRRVCAFILCSIQLSLWN